MSTERSVDETAERPRRRRSRLAVASVAATVLLVGGGGAYFAATASGDSSGGGDRDVPMGNGGTSPPPLALDGYQDGPEGSSPGIAPGEPDPNGARYRVEGKLPQGPDSASVYQAHGEVTEAQVARLAKALGVPGTPTVRGGAWKVGPAKDGFGPSLQVGKEAPGTWTFTRYASGGTDNCPKGKTCSGTSPVAPGGSGDAVSEEAAKKAAAPVLVAVGQEGADLDARQLMGSVRVVNADPKVGGLPTYGVATGVQVGADGQVVGGSGQLKAPDKGAAYPVLSARQTLDRLNDSGRGDGRGGIGGCATAVPHMKDMKDTEGTKGTKGLEGAKGERKPCEPSAKPPEPQPVSVTGARFGLAAHFVHGRQALVPSWLFEVKPQGAPESFTVTHPAVDPKYLKSPSPRAGSPGDDTSGKAVRITSYSVDGKALTVRFWGGVCSDYSAWASEDGDSVRVKVTGYAQEGKVCVAMAEELTETVHLKEPLGDRKVVDGESGRAVPRK